ncbi:hypothetical protein ABW20_dc0102456 [Dactylellina cionopaga]|nr:hypothetical protein ABW20_dc0102456 [Dactylellina cionopaga]
MPSTGASPYSLRVAWRRCISFDAPVIRDIYCAYNCELKNIFQKVGSRACKIDVWTDVWVEPSVFLANFHNKCSCGTGEVDRIWSEYGIELSKFVEAQYDLRTTPYFYKPAAMIISTEAHKEGQKMYLLTFMKLSNGFFRIRQFPPHIIVTSAFSRSGSGLELTVLPDLWHPHNGASKSFALPKYTVTAKTPWLQWDAKSSCFKGKVPPWEELTSILSDDSRMCISIQGDYYLNIGSTDIDLQESLITRLYLKVPEMEDTPAAIGLKNSAELRNNVEVGNKIEGEGVYPPNPLSFLWNSHKLGFEKRHSRFVVEKARLYESQLRHNFSDIDAKDYAANGTFPWDSKEPPIQSWGSITWDDFIEQKRQRMDHLTYDSRGRLEVIEVLEGGPHYGPTECETFDYELDADLEEMREMYENKFHEAQAIFWVTSLYRESMQDRLEDESHDEF